MTPTPDPQLQSLVERSLARLGAAAGGPVDDPRLRRVVAASDFAADTLGRQPDLLRHLLESDGPLPIPAPVLDPDQPAEWPVVLRRYRAAESTRLAWRDITGLDDVETILAGSTALAEQCLSLALEACERDFATRHGWMRTTGGAAPDRLRPRQARRRGAQLQLRHRPGLRLRLRRPGRGQRRPASAGGRTVLLAPGPAARAPPWRAHRRRVLPPGRPAPAPLRQRRPQCLVARLDGARSEEGRVGK